MTVQAVTILLVAMRTNLLGYILSFDNSARNKPDLKRRTKHLGDWQKHTEFRDSHLFTPKSTLLEV